MDLKHITKKEYIKNKEFTGKLDPNAFLDRSVSLEDYLDCYNMPNEFRVCFAKMKLIGQARFDGKVSNKD